MAKVIYSVEIQRPIETVFNFVSNCNNDPLWRAGILHIEQRPGDCISVGARTREVIDFLGKPTETEAEVTEYELNHKVSFCTVRGKISFQSFRVVQPTANGTRFTYLLEPQLCGIYAKASPVIVSTLAKRAQADVSRLKALLESPLIRG
jgi:uncharacterized protein YndB with AHSA1/START domain